MYQLALQCNKQMVSKPHWHKIMSNCNLLTVLRVSSGSSVSGYRATSGLFYRCCFVAQAQLLPGTPLLRGRVETCDASKTWSQTWCPAASVHAPLEAARYLKSNVSGWGGILPPWYHWGRESIFAG